MNTETKFDVVLTNCRIATMDECAKGYGLIEEAAIAWRDGVLEYVGPEAQLPEHQHPHDHHDLDGALVTPGLIDCHTHLVFGGDRADEFEQRLAGVSYEAIAKAGGGILSSVRNTRAASVEELVASSLPRAQDLLADGVTTIEIKSGYGLEYESERRMLQAARVLGEQLGITVKTTLLAAHALPPEFKDNRAEYLRLIRDEWMPHLQREGLIDAVDVYCERIAFSLAETRELFLAAKALNIPIKLHADQLSDTGGAALVAELGGLSADHLEYTTDVAVAAMAKAETVAVLIPAAFYCLRETQLPPIAPFIEHQVPIAIASDLNPGTSPIRSLRLAMNMACTLFRLTPMQALAGTTRHAARALGLQARKGQLRAGFDADLAIWNVQSPAELSYWIGGELCLGTFANGRSIAGKWFVPN